MPHPKPLDFYHLSTELTASAFELYNALGTTKDLFFLDSSKQDSYYSNYSMIGVNPHLIIKYEHGKIYSKDFSHHPNMNQEIAFTCLGEMDLFDHLNSVINQYTVVNNTGLPFIGGGIGYFSYDLSKKLENLPNTTSDELTMPDCYYVFYDNVLLHKNNTNQVHITGLGILDNPKRSVEKLLDQLKRSLFEQPISSQNKSEAVSTPTLRSPFTENSYIEAVNAMRSYMEDGHIYVANMTHTFRGPYEDSPMLTYERLRRINPAPFAAYLDFEDTSVLCSSPERFLQITDKKVQTRPIKGTVPRGKTQEEDVKNRQLLIDSEKDKSELLMIVDLERNDLSKVCRTGSVKVTELFEIETYATVFHLVSTVEGILDDGKTPVDCIKATFPGGSITGAPKIRAMEIIDELEPTSRNIYTGCIGYIGYDGQADFNIVIRTIVIKDKTAYIGVGGGITWESDAKSEYDETLQKIKALFESMGMTI